jgi:hypothetical protein
MNTRPLISHLFPALGGLVFLVGTIYSIVKGSIKIRFGGSIDKSKDPVGFWGLIVGLFLLSAIAIFSAF